MTRAGIAARAAKLISALGLLAQLVLGMGACAPGDDTETRVVAYVTNEGDATVSVIDGASESVVDSNPFSVSVLEYQE